MSHVPFQEWLRYYSHPKGLEFVVCMISVMLKTTKNTRSPSTGSNRRANMVETGTLGGQAWHAMVENSNERLQYLFTSGELSDLDIFFPDDVDPIPIKAHRTILSMSSPVFLAMLTGLQADTKEVFLPKYSRQSFRKLLEHIYLDRMDFESVEEALKVYDLADEYQINSATKECVQYIVHNVKAETVPAVLGTSVALKESAVNTKCKEILDRDPDAVMLSETVSRLRKESLRSLLTDDTLAFSSEVVPFKGLIVWGRAQLNQQEKLSGNALREKIGDDLLKEVRFLSMSCDEFVDNVVDTNVLTHTECIHILRAIRGADPSTLPITTPLHPVRGRRGQRPKERLSCFHLSSNRNKTIIPPGLRFNLISWLSCESNICVHRLDAPSAGTIDIIKRGGEIVSSVASEGPEFVFAPPAALERDNDYNVEFTPKTQLYVSRINGSQRVGNITLSHETSFECALYFRESGSSGSE
ncbi:BTB/POZ domain-containing protein 6-A-like [Oratosquilla oratoria]|uniref:BTB/POZ domain-containing protein 6-A-like n=1 Tax=Oratosquilla oratoria TaxID=337810 RepID=UPI003F75C910